MIVGIMPFRIFLDLCLLRANPQDLPVSNRLLAAALAAHLLANVLSGLDSASPENALLAGAMDTLLLVALTHTGLMLRGVGARTRQTLTALAACGALLTFAAWGAVTLAETVTAHAWVAWLPFLFWFLAVYGHILRNALNVSLGVALALSAGYVLLSLAVTGPFLLPELPSP
ncbi:MAG: hypothetical protein A2V91_05700 [Candidatus Muproteobacteria bacterium RBG_16_64_10]|uniref:Uncharacterized protein n=1 Tax=Candidatus Muproteobacteria bacterium RBG_16_64_10 TaxID=1817757 RepID=A0A1F6SWL4_9PROT|nr:MAG: hypothetical protein A2V91_05700 [Candidatus Muproteobacteria bacterium RBG_16_64_10]